jgi:hypothetical protein
MIPNFQAPLLVYLMLLLQLSSLLPNRRIQLATIFLNSEMNHRFHSKHLILTQFLYFLVFQCFTFLKISPLQLHMIS